jgi:transcriptional regulator with XRE-family HTH domain
MNELGQLLREARERQGISLAEAETQTRIRQKFIAAMEAEDWTLLPNDVTTRGFLRKYAGYLGLDEETVLQRFQSRGNPGAALPAAAIALDREVDYRPSRWIFPRPLGDLSPGAGSAQPSFWPCCSAGRWPSTSSNPAG